MKNTHQTSKMCFVIITQLNWSYIYIFTIKLCVYIYIHFYIRYTPSVAEHENEQEISVMNTYFGVVMET